MKLAIMQPYFFPYIGYFQLLNAVDEFVVYDNIEFTKKGWINRNRMLNNGVDELFTLPLKKDSDYLDIRERKLADDYQEASRKNLRKIQSLYFKAPYYKEVYPLLEDCFLFGDENLFNFIFYAISRIAAYLDIDTQILVSSEIESGEKLKGEARVLSICKTMQARQYINAIGGQALYDKTTFMKEGVALSFIKTEPIVYKQFNHPFISSLSIMDVMMFNSKEEIKNMLNQYTLL